jgi:hypothetical protein
LQSYHRVEEGTEEAAKKNLEKECKRLLNNTRHEMRVQAVRDWYAKKNELKPKAECRKLFPDKTQYMEVRRFLSYILY